MEEESKPRREIRSFVLRTGRMTLGQKKALEEQWPTMGLDIADGVIDPEDIYRRAGPTVFEIGFGMGHSLIEMAKTMPEKNFIGVEVHTPGIGKLLQVATDEELDNIRVYSDDAVEVLKKCIPDKTLDEVLLFFPDPWHKKRHNKRRIVQPVFAQLLREKLKDNGIFHMATDWEDYANHMLQVMSSAEGFENIAGEGNFSERPSTRPVTKFERRGERLGHGVWDLHFRKVIS